MKTIPLTKAICLLNSAERVLIIRNMEMATGIHILEENENQTNFLWLETETESWWFPIQKNLNVEVDKTMMLLEDNFGKRIGLQLFTPTNLELA